MIKWIQSLIGHNRDNIPLPDPVLPKKDTTRFPLTDPDSLVVSLRLTEDEYQLASNYMGSLEKRWGKIYATSGWGAVPDKCYTLTGYFTPEQHEASFLFAANFADCLYDPTKLFELS